MSKARLQATVQDLADALGCSKAKLEGRMHRAGAHITNLNEMLPLIAELHVERALAALAEPPPQKNLPQKAPRTSLAPPEGERKPDYYFHPRHGLRSKTTTPPNDEYTPHYPDEPDPS